MRKLICCFAAAIAVVCMVDACAGVFTPAQGADVLDHAGKLAHCQNVGREAGTYQAYDDCKKDSGI